MLPRTPSLFTDNDQHHLVRRPEPFKAGRSIASLQTAVQSASQAYSENFLALEESVATAVCFCETANFVALWQREIRSNLEA